MNDLDTTRALNCAMSGHRRWKRTTPGRVVTIYGRTVHRADARLPWGRSTHGRGYLTHTVDALYLAWATGQLVGSACRWRCGGSTQHFQLLGEPNSPICPMCILAAGRRDAILGAVFIGRTGADP